MNPHPPATASFPLTLILALALAWPLFTNPAHSSSPPPPTDPSPADDPAAASMVAHLDAPLLFVKRHSYTGIHIYDTYYKWPPGGGGIYVLENPAAPRDQWRIRPVIDPTTHSLGAGVYTHPELSWDATRLLFCYKPTPDGSTSIYEIHLDGSHLRRLTDPSPTCVDYHGNFQGQHDIAPAYLPDGRIVLLSTRPSGLVPCNNTGVAILHVMNADGSDLHPISVNYVNDFDPAILPDGRIVFGRWEYIDKNALTIQSLWTIHPDGSHENALFANNLVFPEALLDTRPVPNSRLLVATLAKHNSTPRGSIAFINPDLGRNNLAALTNLEHPDNPAHDLGDSCEPWPLSQDVVLFSGRPPGSNRNALQLIHRQGHRHTLLDDPDICLHSPMLVRPRPVPPILTSTIDRQATTGRFLVQNVQEGLDGVPPGTVRWLRIIEETSRTSPSTMGGSPYNQTFLVSAALAFSAKVYHGIVPVADDGSAWFEAPAGRPLYLQALDAEGRLVQSMRTFVQAAPGTTRSCIGCHEHRANAPSAQPAHFPLSLAPEPSQPQPESWGSGFLDYPSMVQPVLDRHCVSCHGDRDIAAGLDLSGGWTQHFNISYENLVSRRHSQLVAHWIAGIDCMNGTAFWSSQVFAPRAHGSGAAPLAQLLLSGHDGHLPNLSRTERDLLLAWIDGNGLYHGTWDSTPAGCALPDWQPTRDALISEMGNLGCLSCHANERGQPLLFEEDWINLQHPERSRLLRAPLAPADNLVGDRNIHPDPGLGLGWCRSRPVDPARQRLRLLVNGYAHAVQPVEAFPHRPYLPPDRSGTPVHTFDTPRHPGYQALLAIIRRARDLALANPRVDLPGADILPGHSRHTDLLTPPLVPPPLTVQPQHDGSVLLSWPARAEYAGLTFEIHCGTTADFTPNAQTLRVRTTRFAYHDPHPPAPDTHYILLIQGPTPTLHATRHPPL